jgi:hypothetical protein
MKGVEHKLCYCNQPRCIASSFPETVLVSCTSIVLLIIIGFCNSIAGISNAGSIKKGAIDQLLLPVCILQFRRLPDQFVRLGCFA